MSMPYSVLSCPSCNYQATTMCLWGRFVYRGDSGAEADIKRTLGWCHGCGAVAAIEELPDAGGVKAEQAAAQRRVDALRPGSRFHWLRKLFRDPERAQGLEARAELRRTNLLDSVLENGRGPKCLECGSDNIEPIPLPDREGPGLPHDLELGFRHPGCTMPMRIRDSGGTRFAIVLMKRTYDIEGQLTGNAVVRPGH